jgi:hypothetical protein
MTNQLQTLKPALKTFLEGIENYKYMGIVETACSSISSETFMKVRNEIIKRTRRLCETHLNSGNLFKRINEHAISVINYHIGISKIWMSKSEKSLWTKNPLAASQQIKAVFDKLKARKRIVQY